MLDNGSSDGGLVLMEIRNTSDIRHFLYISDSKLAALYEQISDAPRPISWEAKLDIGIASFKGSTMPEPAPNRI